MVEDETREWPAAPVTSPSTGVAPRRQVNGSCCCTAAVQTPEPVTAKLCRSLADTRRGMPSVCLAWGRKHDARRRDERTIIISERALGFFRPPQGQKEGREDTATAEIMEERRWKRLRRVQGFFYYYYCYYLIETFTPRQWHFGGVSISSRASGYTSTRFGSARSRRHASCWRFRWVRPKLGSNSFSVEADDGTSVNGDEA